MRKYLHEWKCSVGSRSAKRCDILPDAFELGSSRDPVLRLVVRISFAGSPGHQQAGIVRAGFFRRIEGFSREKSARLSAKAAPRVKSDWLIYRLQAIAPSGAAWSTKRQRARYSRYRTRCLNLFPTYGNRVLTSLVTVGVLRAWITVSIDGLRQVVDDSLTRGLLQNQEVTRLNQRILSGIAGRQVQVTLMRTGLHQPFCEEWTAPDSACRYEVDDGTGQIIAAKGAVEKRAATKAIASSTLMSPSRQYILATTA